MEEHSRQRVEQQEGLVCWRSRRVAGIGKGTASRDDGLGFHPMGRGHDPDLRSCSSKQDLAALCPEEL